MSVLTLTMTDIERLETWAPEVLRLGRNADPNDLLEIVTLRARTEVSVAALLDDEKGEPFFAMLRADKACAPHAHNLLYVTEAAAQEAAAKVGGYLNPLSWYGVHAWEMTQEGVLNWARYINRSDTSVKDAHPAEVLQAFEDLHSFQGEKYVQKWFYQPSGAWRACPATADIARLSSCIEQNRASWQDWAGNSPMPGAEC